MDSVTPYIFCINNGINALDALGLAIWLISLDPFPDEDVKLHIEAQATRLKAVVKAIQDQVTKLKSKYPDATLRFNGTDVDTDALNSRLDKYKPEVRRLPVGVNQAITALNNIITSVSPGDLIWTGGHNDGGILHIGGGTTGISNFIGMLAAFKKPNANIFALSVCRIKQEDAADIKQKLNAAFLMYSSGGSQQPIGFKPTISLEPTDHPKVINIIVEPDSTFDLLPAPPGPPANPPPLWPFLP